MMKEIQRIAGIFPSQASNMPLFPPSADGPPVKEVGIQGKNDKIKTERLIPSADIRSWLSLSFEKE